jgi:hypothetical protein
MPNSTQLRYKKEDYNGRNPFFTLIFTLKSIIKIICNQYLADTKTHLVLYQFER